MQETWPVTRKKDMDIESCSDFHLLYIEEISAIMFSYEILRKCYKWHERNLLFKKIE